MRQTVETGISLSSALVTVLVLAMVVVWKIGLKEVTVDVLVVEVGMVMRKVVVVDWVFTKNVVLYTCLVYNLRWIGGRVTKRVLLRNLYLVTSSVIIFKGAHPSGFFPLTSLCDGFFEVSLNLLPSNLLDVKS